MAAPAESLALTVNRRPEFSVDGRYEPRLEVDCLRLEVSEDELGVARLIAVFQNWGRASESTEPDFLYLDGRILELGREITVSIPTEDEDFEIFRGVVMAMEADYPELRSPELIVHAEDRLQLLRMRQRSRFFEQSSDADIASSVASDHGLASDVFVDGPTHAELWQVNQSDLAFLRERARAVDARVSLFDGNLSFKPRRRGDAVPIALTRENDLLRFCVIADLAHQRSEVRVNGWGIDDKAAIHGVAGPEIADLEADGSGKHGPDTLVDLGIEALEEYHLEVPATFDEAMRTAESLMKERSRRFLCGRGTTKGTPSMRVGSQVDLVDLGPRFSGIYHVAEVRHTYDRADGLRTQFVAERAVFGDPA